MDEPRPAPGRLILVATPIGNLADLSPRAVDALAGAGLICCEDTRRTGRLLHHAGLRGHRLAVCNEHTELARVGEVLDVLGAGRDVAVVSDAGTPGISDPGERLARAVLDAGFEVTAIPGPTALVQAVVTSGLPAGRFVFEGFLPRSGRPRRDRLDELAAETRTIVLYEAPHRVVRTLADLADALGADRPVAVARELTKLYETVVRGTLGAVEVGDPRGEYVLVVGGATSVDEPPSADVVRSELRAELAGGSSRRDAAAVVARPARRGPPRGVRAGGDDVPAATSRPPVPTGDYRGRRHHGVEPPRPVREAGDGRAGRTLGRAARPSQRVQPDDRLGTERGLLRPRPHADLRLVGVHPRHDGAVQRARADPPVRS